MTQRKRKRFSFLLSAAVILTSFERSRQVALGTPAQKGTFQIALNKYAERVLGMIEMELMEKHRTGETSQVITSRHFSSLLFTSMSILTSLVLIN